MTKIISCSYTKVSFFCGVLFEIKITLQTEKLFFSKKKNPPADGCSELSNVHEVRQRPSPRPEIDILDLGASSNAS